MKQEPLTIKEFDQRITGYKNARKSREKLLMKTFLSMIALSLLAPIMHWYVTVGVLELYFNLLVVICGFTLFALYVIVSGYKWSKHHGVYCPFCGKSLTVLGEYFKEFDIDERIFAKQVECPKCHKIIAS